MVYWFFFFGCIFLTMLSVKFDQAQLSISNALYESYVYFQAVKILSSVFSCKCFGSVSILLHIACVNNGCSFFTQWLSFLYVFYVYVYGMCIACFLCGGHRMMTYVIRPVASTFISWAVSFPQLSWRWYICSFIYSWTLVEQWRNLLWNYKI